jgi:chromatin remodeling complex protein RSC6
MVKKKTSTKKSAAPAAAPASKAKAKVVAAPVAPEPPSMGDQFNALLEQLTTLRSQLTAVTSQVRLLSKRAEREVKLATKTAKRKRKAGNRAPSGFVKPTKISLELAKFLGKPKGTEMARTEVTREINGYIRANKLQDPQNGRRILADTKLKKLLKLTDKDELTYFNLQRYMSPHFAKAGQAAPVTSV